MTFRVVASTLTPWRVRPPRPVGSTTAPQSVREGIVLALRDPDGVVGYGEASPLPGFSPDDLTACVQALTAVHRALPREIPVNAPLTGSNGLCTALPAARFALETALYDLASRRRGVPVSVCLGGVLNLSPVALHAPIGAALDVGLTARATDAVASGYATLKVKVGQDFDREHTALSHLREAVGDRIALRLDANGAWSLAEARAHLRALREIAPALVEQPVAGAAVLRLGICDVPWAADECLADPGVAEGLLTLGRDSGCGVFVLKPFVLGGISRARDLAVRASRAGFGVVVTHGFDGPVGVAGACALALSLPVRPLACGLARHPALVGDVGYLQGVSVMDVRSPGLPVAGFGAVSWT